MGGAWDGRGRGRGRGLCMLCLVVVVLLAVGAVEMFDVGRWLGAVRVLLVFLYLYQTENECAVAEYPMLR